MNILIFYQYFGTPKGGWSTRFYEFSKRWVDKGHNVTVVTSPYYKSDILANSFISKKNIEGINLIIINSPDSNKFSFIRRVFNSLRFSMFSTYFSLTRDYDIVLTSSGPITIAIPGLISKFLRNKIFVFEVRDLWPTGAIQTGNLKNKILIYTALLFEKLIYHFSDLIVTCSIGMNEEVRRINQKTPKLIISNSSDLELFSQLNGLPSFPKDFDLNIPVFLYAGSLGFMDDCSQIIEGFSKVDRGLAQLVFIGDGNEKNKLESLVRKYSLSNLVWFIGLIPKVELVNWFHISRASIVTFKNISIFNTNSPNKFFDSLAAGIPVIQSTKGWIFELIEKEECGINVEVDNPISFKNAIIKLSLNPVLAQKMGISAKAVATRDFDRSKLSDLYLNNLLKLIKE